jgi:prolyl oligopeptidase
LIRIDIDAGHGAGKSTSAMAQEHADIQSFALFNMGWKGFD